MSTNIISGKVIHSESGLGILNLLVVVIDLDPNTPPEDILDTTPPEDLKNSPERLGSVLTDFNGNFSLSYEDIEFQTQNPKEKRPDISIQILAPEDASSEKEPVVLYKTVRPRQNVGRQEAFMIKISSKQLIAAGIGLPGAETVKDIDKEVDDEVKEYIQRKEKSIKLQNRIAEIDRPEILERLNKRKENRKAIIETLSKRFDKTKLGGEVVKENESIEENSNTVIARTIERANQAITSGKGVPVNLYLTPSDRQRLSRFFLAENLSADGLAIIPESELGDILFRTTSSENPGTLLIKNSPFANFCKPDSSGEQCAKINTGIIGNNQPGDNAIPEPVIETPELSPSDIPKYVGKLIGFLPSPDSVLNPDAENRRADNSDIVNNVNSFSLSRGPADMTAFYDFNYLQLAFEHVWKQLFDEEIIQATQKVSYDNEHRTGNRPFTTNTDINEFTSSAGEASENIQTVPVTIARYFDITEEEYNLLPVKYQQTLFGDICMQIHFFLDDPSKNYIVQKLREQGEQLIDRVRLGDYSNLHKTIKDLKERLSGKYEFTVYAADKNFHYINFGLLNTYRQQWTPLNYQTGKLLKTMPLSPKEERKYALKISRNEKRTIKEARKNSSAISNEQSSTSKVESDIVKKAQNKTNFNLAIEGEYDVWISSGKVTTNFGIEAQNESSENRKDMRESILKATQEYKDDYSMEVDTEENSSYEYNESGTIVNPNDELTVTYLFYELQRRFRLSEKLYRVMPVVLVAQEVPSPNQITEAWVVAHDWILNRSLLDDSFRSTLQHISNKSVGDDFAIRELRKNLRQQRSLVETLRIELSIASAEAANRYKGLEKNIEDRIGIEAAENTETWFSNVSEFFGGDDRDPESAKARELAAQDAHRYSVEKAEKAAAALRQEVNNLNALTSEYNKNMQSHLDNAARIKRLLVHIRNNILYYMQCIWKMEPPDQRFLRLHHVKVASLELGTMQHPADTSVTSSKFYFVEPEVSDDIFRDFREKEFNEDGSVRAYTEKHKAFIQGVLKPKEELAEPFKPLVQVADLDNLLGFKGNYMIFPLKEHNALTEFMAAPYVDSAFGAMDPDELSNVSLDEYSNYVCCLHKNLSEEAYNEIKPQLKKWLELLLADSLRNGDEITVPTTSLFIEALPGAHTLLEDFKLRHRKLDVFKVQAEVRKMELENLRYAARLLNEEREDPDVDKRIEVVGNNGGIVNPTE